MPKLPVKVAPLMLAAQAAMAAREHWSVLEPAERAELARILRTSSGRPANLTAREKAELRRLVGKLDLPGLGRDLVPLASKHRGRRR